MRDVGVKPAWAHPGVSRLVGGFMRILIGRGMLFAKAIAGAAGGCSKPAPTQEAGVAPNEYTQLSNILGHCGTGQSEVADALQGSDTAAILSTLETAERACASAVVQLRRTPIPSVNSPKAAEVMAKSMGQISDAVRIMDSAPRRARAKAQIGMRTYKSALEKLRQAGA